MVSEVLAWVRTEWISLAQVGAVVFSALTSFLTGPPVGSYDAYEESLTRFGRFIVIVVVGLLGVLTWRFKRLRDAKIWGLVSGFCLLAGTVMYFNDRNLRDNYTVEYNSVPIVVGSDADYTEFARLYMKENPGLTKKELVYDFAGQITAIWTAEAVNSRRMTLAISYICLLPIFTIVMLSVLQAIRCLKEKDPTPS